MVQRSKSNGEKENQNQPCPVLTLWATIVAERLGYKKDEALTFGKAVAGLNAQSKGRRLGIYEEKTEEEKKEEKKKEKPVKLSSSRYLDAAFQQSKRTRFTRRDQR